MSPNCAASQWRRPDGARLCFNLYVAVTALHAIHVLVGVLVLAGAAPGVWRIEFCGLYWRLVDIIWIFPFPVLYLVGWAMASDLSRPDRQNRRHRRGAAGASGAHRGERGI